jgi:hypothetical protein
MPFRPDPGGLHTSATYQPEVYHQHSALIIVVLGADCREKEWCGREWRAIVGLIKQRRDDDVMLFRADRAAIPGLYSIDGYAPVDAFTAAEAATLILQALALGEGKARDCYLFAAASPCPASSPRSSAAGAARSRGAVAPWRDSGRGRPCSLGAARLPGAGACQAPGRSRRWCGGGSVRAADLPPPASAGAGGAKVSDGHRPPLHTIEPAENFCVKRGARGTKFTGHAYSRRRSH